MGLKEYKNKRDFSVSPEPSRDKSAKNDRGLIFVVQKHAASHLHYDLRLEYKGVLKSWAVPKGLPTAKDIKRLAVMVEDHPLDYAFFEGEIPEGQYGAGHVEIWDSGTWEPSAKHQNIGKALREGLLEFRFHGKRLKGEYVLVETKDKYTDNGWLLFKK